MEVLLADLLRQGLLGVVTALAIWIAWKKDRQIQVMCSRWLEKTEKQTEKYHELSAEMTATIKELALAQEETAEELKQIQRLLLSRGSEGL